MDESDGSAPASPQAALLNADSSADEETVIMRGPTTRGMDYQSTKQVNKRGSDDGVSTRRRRQLRDEDNGEQEHEEIDEQQGWWAKLISEYGSIELENKGSVARDHLALGMSPSGLELLAWILIDSRTNVPRLVADIACVCFNWHCYHTTLSPQCYCGGRGDR